MDTRPLKKQSVGYAGGWGFPADIGVILLFVGLTDVLLIGTSTDAALARALFALPAILFVPGYVVLAAAFPSDAAGDRTDASGVSDDPAPQGGESAPFGTRSIDWSERVALSFGLSVAVIPLLGLVVAPIWGSVTLEPILIGLNAFILVGAAVGVVRRNRLPKDERFRVPYRRWTGTLREAIFGRPSRIDGALTALLLVSALVAASSMGVALLDPLQGESYTSATLLTENDDGDLVAAGYPTDLDRADSEELILRVDNHEGVETTYTLVVALQRVDTSGDSATVTAEDVVARERNTVEAGDTWLARHTVTPTMTGEDLRLAYLLYRGDAPEDPSVEGAYRTLYLWIDVSDGTESG